MFEDIERMEIDSGDGNMQLRKRAMRALALENTLKARITALQAELTHLETELANQTPTTQAALEHFAQTECQALTSRLLDKLPREVRDMIYQHLSTRSNELIEREHFRTTLDPVTKLYSYDYNRWKSQHFPAHYWSTHYTPPQFHQELVENYYRTSTFVFGDEPGVLKRFLTTDEMRIGMLPAVLVRRVEIGFGAVSYHRGSFGAYMFGVPRSGERVRGVLDGLEELGSGARVVIRVGTQGRDGEARDDVSGLLEGMGGVLGRLEVRVLVDEGGEGKGKGMGEDWRAMHG